MKIVLDTNILISAIFWKGPPNLILQLAEKQLITIVSSKEILEEFFTVVSRPKFSPYLRQSGYTPKAVLEEISLLAQITKISETVTGIVQDSSDDKFLSCAISAMAPFLISGDKHLLLIKKFRGVSIATPAQFLKFFNQT